MSKMNSRVDAYLAKNKNWLEESETLRTLLLSCGLDEDLKWGKPCYSFQGNNIAIIQGFKQYFALLFFKGVLLKDPKGILIKTGENTHVGRQARFVNVQDIVKKSAIIKAYIKESIELEKAGVKVDRTQRPALIFPDEFQNKLKQMPALKKAFEALTPGRQRAYHIYFTQPKQPQTRESRIMKCIPGILKGKGINEL